MKTRRKKQGGFTLLETVVALGILAVATLGAFAGVIYASRDLREGQLRQYKMLLAEASAQRALISDKTSWAAIAVARPATSPSALAVGAGPWAVDPSPVIPGDLGTGAYFTVTANGDIKPVNPGAPVPCNSPLLPDGTFCREVLLTQGLPAVDGGILPAGSRQVTQWIRISRKGDPLSMAVVRARLLAQ